jgi:hypothetical protein
MTKSLIAMLLFGLAWPALAAAPVKDPEEATPLPPVDVTGKRTPLDSDRARYEKMAPCIGCDGTAGESESFLMKVLNFTVLPSEPPDDRDIIPISDKVKPLDRFKDKLP